MNKIDMDFNNLIGELSDKQFWEYVSSWYDEQSIMDTMNSWDTETKEEAIKELKEILKGGFEK